MLVRLAAASRDAENMAEAEGDAVYVIKVEVEGVPVTNADSVVKAVLVCVEIVEGRGLRGTVPVVEVVALGDAALDVEAAGEPLTDAADAEGVAVGAAVAVAVGEGLPEAEADLLADSLLVLEVDADRLAEGD